LVYDFRFDTLYILAAITQRFPAATILEVNDRIYRFLKDAKWRLQKKSSKRCRDDAE